MLNKFKQTQAQWGGSSDVIDHWLETRQSLIVEYCKLANLQPSSNTQSLSTLPTAEELQDFSQHLVDYISEGHFKIYDMVMDKWRSTGFKATEDIDQAYAKIVLTTEPLLSFTDNYAETNEETNLDSLDDDLSKIGEIITLRFEKEDQLIQLIADSLAIPPGA
ncbi:sigma D regulator [Vibrio agarivorans]|uniref:Sigma D regulator n=1 Tax=Vibrio agarivorans TaxID=153622 RepID=A0ABT7XWC5_9VIBR|nr:sigma D regulator [Vibrio agarivorans]MDN2480076.1 sigma D regulator [Vibrio agarivorans]